MSCSRVSQVLRLLKLAPQVIAVLELLGDPIPIGLVPEKKLYSLVEASPEEQKQEVGDILRKKGIEIPDW